MSCQLTTGFLRGCADNVGGIRNFYLANRPTDLALVTDASGNVTDITGTSLSWHRYEPRPENSFWQEEITKDRANGTTFYAQTATIMLQKDDQNKRNEIKLLSQAEVVIIVEDMRGNYFLLGENVGLTMDTSKRASGTATGDMNGYTLNFMSNETDMAPQVELGAFSAEIANDYVAGTT